MGTPAIERLVRGMVLTATEQVFAWRANMILNEVCRAKVEVDQVSTKNVAAGVSGWPTHRIKTRSKVR